MSESRLWRELRADATRLGARVTPARVLLSALVRRCHRPLVTLRLAQAAARSRSWRWTLPLWVLLHRLARHAASMDLPWRVQLGEGARIDHGYALVVNAGAQIGSNVTLFHGVTLGQADRIAADGSRTTGYPQIEDEVWIGPHAVIVGPVRIGRGSRIGGGAFVNEDVPPHSLVMGNPGQVVRSGVRADVEHPWHSGAPAAADAVSTPSSVHPAAPR